MNDLSEKQKKIFDLEKSETDLLKEKEWNDSLIRELKIIKENYEKMTQLKKAIETDRDMHKEELKKKVAIIEDLEQKLPSKKK